MQPFDFINNEQPDLTSLRIESERLALLSINNSFSAEIFKEFNNNIIQYMLPKPAERIEETLAFITESLIGMREGWNLVLAITNKVSGEFLGCCGLHGKGRYQTPELGIWVKKSAHGHKYGLEAIRSLSCWAVETLDLDYIIYPVDQANIPSRKIPEAMGGVIFKEKKVKTARGTVLDELCYKLTVDQLKQKR
ncbi:GNAT family N-acetyltransferase [bacterium]|nr:GNAT family N-acetyltransferase [bacterium]